MPQATYCYVRVVGRGSYGEVTLVKHRRDGKQVGDLGPCQGVEGRGARWATSKIVGPEWWARTHLRYEASFPTSSMIVPNFVYSVVLNSVLICKPSVPLTFPESRGHAFPRPHSCLKHHLLCRLLYLKLCSSFHQRFSRSLFQ